MAIPFMIGFLDSKIKAANKREKGSYTESARNLDIASAQRVYEYLKAVLRKICENN